MKMTKVLGSAALFTAIFATTMNPVSAASNQGNPNQVQALGSVGGLEYQLVVNGNGLSKDQLYVNAQNEIMIAARMIAEQLDYRLTWDEGTQTVEFFKGNQWFMAKIGENRYNIGKMYITLGTAPELQNQKTYVPLSFIKDVMGENVTISEAGTVMISSQENIEMDEPMKEGTITNITTDKHGTQVELNGFIYGLRLNITEETEIIAEDNCNLTASDLMSGMAIKVVPDRFATLSIPPMTNARKIIVKESSSQAMFGTAGEITKVTTLSDGGMQVTVKGEKIANEGYEQIVLNLTKDTQILGTKENQSLRSGELKKGMKVYAFYGPMTTKSMPPIGTAMKILVESE
ncbi:copper amine oxidase N-terminal domain-containing protein [Bacillus chungangensis]|uniref:Copper amine oxidase-like N-terminal domain-containing protein n=1 Tax=Bacillus chungangensis TaxID=587633 RepID=A0ABT9WQ00_9BACI|nr:copper amine oxidase N-terminal domain-containing protein [Bacillus chungangensis]MDQ0174840.1 hypothetical protein [Bacillus chungangensis]